MTKLMISFLDKLRQFKEEHLREPRRVRMSWGTLQLCREFQRADMTFVCRGMVYLCGTRVHIDKSVPYKHIDFDWCDDD